MGRCIRWLTRSRRACLPVWGTRRTDRRLIHSDTRDSRVKEIKLHAIGRRLLIANADDFGMSHGVNAGILEAHTRGIVTSASLLVRWPAAKEAAIASENLARLNVGLHVDLGEWSYEAGQWVAKY